MYTLQVFQIVDNAPVLITGTIILYHPPLSLTWWAIMPLFHRMYLSPPHPQISHNATNPIIQFCRGTQKRQETVGALRGMVEYGCMGYVCEWVVKAVTESACGVWGPGIRESCTVVGAKSPPLEIFLIYTRTQDNGLQGKHNTFGGTGAML